VLITLSAVFAVVTVGSLSVVAVSFVTDPLPIHRFVDGQLTIDLEADTDYEIYENAKRPKTAPKSAGTCVVTGPEGATWSLQDHHVQIPTRNGATYKGRNGGAWSYDANTYTFTTDTTGRYVFQCSLESTKTASSSYRLEPSELLGRTPVGVTIAFWAAFLLGPATLVTLVVGLVKWPRAKRPGTWAEPQDA